MSILGPRLGVVASALSEDPRQSPRMARTLGFHGLQFAARSSHLALTDLTESGLREIRHLCTNQDQQIIGLRTEVGPHGLAPGADVDQILSKLSRVMQTAATLQSRLVCVDIGPLPEPPPAPVARVPLDPGLAGAILIPVSSNAPPAPVAPPPPPVDPNFISQVHAALDELGRIADRYSVAVAFRSELSSLAALDSALRKVNCFWFGIDLDPPALLRDDWSIDDAFARVGTLVRHVRARDAVSGGNRRTQSTVIGRGDIEWPRLLSDLDAADYHGWFTLDPLDLPDRFAATTAGALFLQKI